MLFSIKDILASGIYSHVKGTSGCSRNWSPLCYGKNNLKDGSKMCNHTAKYMQVFETWRQIEQKSGTE